MHVHEDQHPIHNSDVIFLGQFLQLLIRFSDPDIHVIVMQNFR